MFPNPISRIVLISTLASAPMLYAEEILGPVLGLVHDPGVQALRAVKGVPGASLLGTALNLGAEIHRAASAPDFTLAVAGERKNAFVLGAAGELRALEGIREGASRIVLSPSGSAAALVFPEIHLIEVISGLPHDGRLRRDIWLPEGFDLEALAVADDAGAVLLSSREGEGGAVWVVPIDDAMRRIPSLGRATAIAFLPGAHDAILADAGSNTLLIVRDVLGAASVSFIAGEKEGIDNPAAVAASKASDRVYVANAGSGLIAAYALDGRTLSFTLCNCTPVALDRMNGIELFRLTGLSADAPLLLYDAAPEEPRVLVVPPDLPAPADDQQNQQGDRQ